MIGLRRPLKKPLPRHTYINDSEQWTRRKVAVQIEFSLTRGFKRRLKGRRRPVKLANHARVAATLSSRQRQLLPELVDHSLSALDLPGAGWTKR